MKNTVPAILVALLLAACLQPGTANKNTFVQPTAAPIGTAAPTPWAQDTAGFNASLQPPAPTPSLTKLDSAGLSRFLIQFTAAPQQPSWCRISCERLKTIIREATCSQARSGEYQNPFFSLINGTTLRQNPDASDWDVLQACMRLAPDVIFDCDAFANETLSCGEGLSGCQDGGFHLQFDRVRFRNETGLEVDTRVFVDSRAFKRVLDEDDCYKPQ